MVSLRFLKLRLASIPFTQPGGFFWIFSPSQVVGWDMFKENQWLVIFRKKTSIVNWCQTWKLDQLM